MKVKYNIIEDDLNNIDLKTIINQKLFNIMVMMDPYIE